jgi:ubiquinone/menaquinone biosynthesis C-methylase UbiE
MGVYSKVIYPKLLERSMSKPSIMKLRKKLLSEVNGEILEVGFGTGLNLGCYPDHIKKITVIDVNDVLGEKARKRIDQYSISVDYRHISAEKLPFEDNCFDSVVSTFTFCSIPDIQSALSEFYRVLKPGGRLFFLEHGISSDKSISFFQNLINPIFKVASCSLNRDMKAIIDASSFNTVKLEQFYQEDAIKVLGYLYMGIAVKN